MRVPTSNVVDLGQRSFSLKRTGNPTRAERLERAVPSGATDFRPCYSDRSRDTREWHGESVHIGRTQRFLNGTLGISLNLVLGGPPNLSERCVCYAKTV